MEGEAAGFGQVVAIKVVPQVFAKPRPAGEVPPVAGAAGNRLHLDVGEARIPGCDDLSQVGARRCAPTKHRRPRRLRAQGSRAG